MKKLVIAGLMLLCGLAQAQSDSPSTTTVSATYYQGYISVNVTANYTSGCFNNDSPTPYSATIGSSTQSGSAYGSFSFGPYGSGTYTVTGSFSGFGGSDGSGNFCEVDGSSGSTTVTIPTPQPSQLSISTPYCPPTPGQPLVLTVNAMGAYNPTNGPYPTGKVILFYGATPLASAALQYAYSAASSATFTFPTTGLSPGTYNVSANYGGDSNFTGSAAPTTVVTIDPTREVTYVTNEAGSSDPVYQAGTDVPLFVEILAYGDNAYNCGLAQPTGTLTFSTGSTKIATVKLNPEAGITYSEAIVDESSAGLPVGTYPITASYSGDAKNLPSSTSWKVTLDAGTTTTLAASPATVQAGKPITISAAVARSGVSGVPTGSVDFTLDGNALSTVPLNAKGQASTTLTTTNWPSGTYTVGASYSGDSIDFQSSSSVTVTIQ